MDQSVSNLVGRFTTYIIDPILAVLFAFTTLVFMWGVVEFLWNSRNGKDIATGKNHMMWGIIGMFIMVSVSGIVWLLNDTFGLNIQNPDTSSLNEINFPVNFGG